MINKERIVEQFKKLVSIDSPSLKEREMGDYLKEKLVELGLEVYEDETAKIIGGNCGNIYGTYKGNQSLEPLLFCVHMDTVEPAKGKKAVVHEDGTITSAGDTILGADDLAGVTAILEGLQVIKENNLETRPIEILFTVAEEIYCVGSAHIDYSRLKSKEAYVLDLTGPIGDAAYKAPTFLSFEINVKGKASHAGFAPEKGINAIAVVAKSISSIKQGRIDEDTTVNIGTISGGLATNIVSDHCVVKGEVRSYSKEKAKEQMELIQTAFDLTGEEFGAEISINTKTMVDAYETPLDHSVVKRFEEACQKNGLESNLSGTFGGSDNNHLAVHGIAGIVMASAMNECHSTKEYTSVEDLCKISELTLSLMTMDH